MDQPVLNVSSLNFMPLNMQNLKIKLIKLQKKKKIKHYNYKAVSGVSSSAFSNLEGSPAVRVGDLFNRILVDRSSKGRPWAGMFVLAVAPE
jgi:hypothetical protein